MRGAGVKTVVVGTEVESLETMVSRKERSEGPPPPLCGVPDQESGKEETNVLLFLVSCGQNLSRQESSKTITQSQDRCKTLEDPLENCVCLKTQGGSL